MIATIDARTLVVVIGTNFYWRRFGKGVQRERMHEYI